MRRVVIRTLAFAAGLTFGFAVGAQDAPKPTPAPTTPPAPATPIPDKAAKPTPTSPDAATPTKPAAALTDASAPTGAQIEVVAEFPGLQCTGVAISKTGRLFVCFPRWRDALKYSLMEINAAEVRKPYPNDVWNGFVENTEEHRGLQFVCIQSIKLDEQDRLWVLDAGAPRMQGVKRSQFDGGGPKLIEFDLEKNLHRRVFRVAGATALETSYLNDFEVDNANNIGYITDSGEGAIILVNLRTYETKRVLERHPSVKADPTVVPILNGNELRDRKGHVPKVHADGIALDRTNGYLYYQPLIGRKLYRIKTQVLIDVLPGRTLTGEQKNTVAAAVEEVDDTVMTDGMLFDTAGNLYFTAIEKDAVMMRTPDGIMRDIVGGAMISWPDSFAIGPKVGKTASDTEPQYLYFTTSQIHLTDWFSADGSNPKDPFRIVRTRLPGK